MLGQEKIPTIEDMKYIEMGHSEPYFQRNFFVEPKDSYAFANHHNNIGIYRSAYRYNVANNDDVYDSYLFSHFYMDFDSEEDIELAREDLLFVIWKMNLKTTYGLPLESFRIYFSGKKGFHLLIPYEYLGIKPSKYLDRLFKWIAGGLYLESVNETIDLVVYEKRRLWRLENTKHPGTNLYKIPLEYKEVINLTIEEIQELAKKPRVIKYPEPKYIDSANKEYLREAKEMIEQERIEAERFKNYKPQKQFDKDNIPDYIQQMLDEGPIKNYRNETVAGLTSFYMQIGYSEEEIYQEMLAWNQGSLSDSEIKTTVSSIFKRKLIYSKKRLKALADKDMTGTITGLPKRNKTPIWKKDIQT